jgi:predicted acyl esterase
MPRHSRALIAANACLVLLACGASPKPVPVPTPGANEQLVAMRDGVRLATSIYLPTGAEAGDGPWPAILRRTPYGKDLSIAFDEDEVRIVPIRAEDTEPITSRGYALVLQDVRGRFRSEGEYAPYESQLTDGYDAVEWVAAQPWCNGRVGISGGSALGIHANLAAAAAPPHLEAAFVVVAPASLLYQGRFIGGAFKWADGGGWMQRQGMSEQAIRDYAGRAVLDQRWLDNDFVFQRHAVQIPIYNVGGWYDLFAAGSIDNFVYLQRHGREGARGRQKLRMGAFGHGPRLAGELAYPGATSLRDTLPEELRWFDYWLKGIDNGIASEPPVHYYRMAAARRGEASQWNGMRTATTWPPNGSRRLRLYLAGEGGLRSEAPGPESAGPTRWVADPTSPVPTLGGANLMLAIGPEDQRPTRGRDDVLRFETPPLDADVVVAGEVRAELFVASDAPDTDFAVKLVDVYPDGYEALLLDSILRARYREGRRPEAVKPLTAGLVERIEISLGHTSNVFEAGHRIALHLSSSNHPRFDINPQTGAATHEAGEATRVANNAVYHEAQRPSALLLQILESPRD